ncbi:MAG: FctA domain-containing protein [Olsenella sp.]|nr:FctA domain-containing protein [Olsenella sp.]
MKRMHWRPGSRAKVAIVAVLVAAAVAMVGKVAVSFAASAADAEPPKVAKTLTPNGDGTYKLSLSVTGSASSAQESSKANVVVVFDTSGSMDETTTSYEYSETTDDRNTYGLVDGEYVKLTYHWNWGNKYWTDPSGARYEGVRYKRSETRTSRLAVAKAATNNLIDQLLANNTRETPDAVEVSLVSFSSKVNDSFEWSTDASALKGTVSGFKADGGTNWEAALNQAKDLADERQSSQPGEATYVIFVSDGNPTFRDSRYSNRASDYNETYGVWGTGNSDPNGWNFGAAKGVADSLIGSGYKLYSIGAFGDATVMQQLGGTYYDATDSAALSDAFEQIVNQITSAVAYKDVTVEDKVTDLTSVSIKASGASGFTYTKGGEAWTDAPAATYENGTVKWDLGDQRLANGVTYTVSFDVWPSQEALDLVADLKNGRTTYDGLTAEQKAQLVDNGDGTYSLNTNAADGNTVSYTRLDTVSTGVLPDGAVKIGDNTWTKDGFTYTYDEATETYVGTKEGTGSADFQNPDPIATASSQVVVHKSWTDGIDDGTPDSVVLNLISDGEDRGTVELSSANGWQATRHVSPGVMTVDADGNVTVLEGGHDYTVQELAASNPGLDLSGWEFSTGVLHPMYVNGTLTDLVRLEDGSGLYKIGDSTYNPVSATEIATIEALNVRKSELRLTKHVIDLTDGSVPTDASFSFEGSLTTPDGSAITFTAVDARQQPVSVEVTGATQQADGSYVVSSGATFNVKLKGAQSLVFTSLPTGTTYAYTEKDLPRGFSLKSISSTTSGENETGDPTTKGAVSAPNNSYLVVYANEYDSATLGGNDALAVTKAVSGHDAIEQFSFELSPADDATQEAVDGGAVVLPESTTATTSTDGYIKAGTSERVPFGDVTFFSEGTYSFNVRETNTTTAGGWTYDNTPKTISVVVAKANGKLVATSQGNDPTVTNAYKAAPTKGNVSVRKTLAAPEGANVPDITGKFTFTLEAVGDAPMPAAGGEVVTNPDTTGGTAAFGDITFTAPGTYTYNVSESGSVPGVQNDSVSPKQVTVDVVDNGDGTLTATANGGQPVEFTNSYNFGEVIVTIDVTKVLEVPEGLEGPKSIKGAYTFTLSPKDGAPMPIAGGEKVTNPAEKGGTAKFGQITYTKPGTYMYTVTESGEVAGITNDAKATSGKTVTVVVRDNGDGTLTATANDGEAVTFTNAYDIKDDGKAQVSIPVKKVVQATGGSTVPAWSYTFELLDAEGKELSSKTVSSDANDATAAQSATFDTITYDKPGTYTYTVTESGTVDGIINDAEATSGKTVTVVVRDEGDGTLSASSTSTTDAPLTFTNTYEATSHGVAKVWSGDDELTELRPSSITVYLFANGNRTDKTLELSSTNGWSGTFHDLPKTGSEGAPIEYTTEEKDVPAGYLASYKELNGGHDSVVTNTLKTGSLTVSKTVAQDDGLTAPSKVFNFKIELVNNKSVNGMLSGLLFENGTAQFDLEDGQELTLTGLPAGDYTVTETPVAGFTTTSEGATGTISSDKASTAAFTNTYKAEPATLELAASKTLAFADGLNAPDVSGKYTFTLSAADGAPLPGTTSVKNVDGKGGASSFGIVTYTKPGTYTYTVTESGEVAGVTNDSQATGGKTVVVKVTDNGVGQLHASVTEGSATTNFTNTYSATGELDTSTTAILEKTVVADGTAWADKTFSFQLVPLTGSPEPEDLTASVTFSEAGTKTVPFGKIVFGKPGTYSYQVFETTESGDGWTCDNNVHDVTIKVTDNGNGTLKAEVQTPAVITNTYATTPVTDATLQVTKSLSGADLSAGLFTFELRNADGTLVSEASNDVDGMVTFSGLSYESAGTYTYTISERNDGEPGYTYDSTASTVKVTVTDNGDGTLSASPEYSKTTFDNSYTASGDVTVSARKTLHGRQIKDGQFTFELLDSEGKVIQTTTNEGESVKFNLHYDESIFADAGSADAAATSAASDATTGATSPTSGDAVTAMTAADEATGATSSEGTAAGASAAATTGTDASATTGAASGDGSSAAANEVVPSSPEPGSSAASDGGSAGANLAKGLEGLLATEANAAEADGASSSGKRTKAFAYTIREVNDGKAGYSYATNTVPVRVTVTDEGNGKITAVATYTGDTTFENDYEATGSTTITAKKELEGKALEAGQFSFTLTDEASREEVATTTNAADGTVSFHVTFDESQVGDNYFVLAENGNAARGYTYDAAPRWVKVHVEDNGDGTLKVSEPVFSLSPEKQEGSATTTTFKNSYKPLETSVQLRVQKRLEGRGTPLVAGEFAFQLKDEATGETVTATNDAGGNVIFGTWTYTEAGTYTYEVRELEGEGPGITYDTETHEIKVEVQDVDGQLQATVSPEALIITNTYKATKVTTDELTARKDVSGFEGGEYPIFSFRMQAVDAANPMPEGSEGGSKTVELQGPGDVSFGTITFDKAGTYQYLVFEVKDNRDGWTCDQTQYLVTYDVTDDGKGQLKQARTIQRVTGDGIGDEMNAMSFVNTYSAKPVTVADPPVEKKVTGYEGDAYPAFSFTMRAEDKASPMPEGSTSGSKTVLLEGPGKVEFGRITFDKPGTYTYRVWEKQLHVEGWTCDQTQFLLTYEVTDDGKGQLVARLTVRPVAGDVTGDAVGEATFTNSYQKPGSSVPESPRTPSTTPTTAGTKPAPRTQGRTPSTGDYALGAGGIALLGAGVVAIAAILRRRGVSK